MASAAHHRTPPSLAALHHRQSALPVAGGQAAACPEPVEGVGSVALRWTVSNPHRVQRAFPFRFAWGIISVAYYLKSKEYGKAI